MGAPLGGVTDPDKISVAVHEAGHAVVAVLTGCAVRYATLAPRGAAGAVVLRPRRTGFPRQETIAVSCAGLIAEDMVGVDDRWDITYASDGDGDGDIAAIRDDARAWHAASDGATVLDLAARSWAMAFDLIVHNYGAVLAVAEALLSSRRALTGRQIRVRINGAPAVRPEAVPDDGRTFWVPEYSVLRNWGPAPRRRRKAA